MFDYQLFIGFPKDPLFEKELQKANKHLIDQFIRSNGEYLEEINHQGMSYLGKKLGKLSQFSEIVLIEANIYSILKKLVPDFPYDETPLILFPIPESPHAKRTK
jgi:hypothetical protein